MSRIGNTPIMVPKDVTIKIAKDVISVNGPKGTLAIRLPQGIDMKQENGKILLVTRSGDVSVRALHGLARAILSNAVVGVTTGWSKTLELVGVGYRAAMANETMQLSLGFSHPIVISPPEGITFQVVEGKIVISGVDKQRVGEMAATIRKIKKPEPYKGKGIRYLGERVRKKAGKAAKAIGGAVGAK